MGKQRPTEFHRTYEQRRRPKEPFSNYSCN